MVFLVFLQNRYLTAEEKSMGLGRAERKNHREKMKSETITRKEDERVKENVKE